MTKEITLTMIPAHVLKGMLLAAAKEDVRYYLKGVYFDTARGRLVATTGHVMIIAKMTFEPNVKSVDPVIVPRAMIETALKGAKSDALVAVEIGPRPQKGSTSQVRSVRLITGATSVSGTEVDAKYPDYERVVPKKFNGEPAQLNHEYVGTIGKALCLIETGKPSGKQTRTHYTGADEPAVMVAGSSAIGIVMPFRTKDGGPLADAIQNLGFKEKAQQQESQQAA